MTLYGEPEVWLEQFPLGEPQPFTCHHLSLLKIVQASDLSALATTLNRELPGFIRQLLS